MIIISMLNKSPAPYVCVGMVIAGGQDVKGFVIMELALLWVRKIPWRRKWQPTPVLFLGESHGGKSLVGTVHGVAKSRTRLSDFPSFLSLFLTVSVKCFELPYYLW